MIVYADREELVSTRALLDEIEAISDPEEALIRYGQWEAAALDALCPEVDEDVDPRASPLPATLRIRPQEGFAYYALYPEQYRRAARLFLETCHPGRCVVIGIRSIGTALSTAVAEALPCPVWRFTVRPHGHPFDRRISLSESLCRRIRERREDHFLVVDEGPGLSGSSFASVAEKLNELGVPDGRIVFLPSHLPDIGSLVSERARTRWPRHRCFTEPFDEGSLIPEGARDLSGGQWRELLGCEVAVQPQHERRKYLQDGVLWKFVGLAHYGNARLQRARELFSAGFAPEPLGLEHGFLLTRWEPGVPAAQADSELTATMARYLAFLATRFSTARTPDYDRLIDMIRVNAGVDCTPPPACGTTVALDGRMLPHEWIRTARGWVKTDALDHHDDHFFAGCQDIAWDVAGAGVEFGFDPRGLASAVARLTRDSTLPARLPFYTVAYVAYRIGYCTLAAKTLGESCLDGRRFTTLSTRYRAVLPTV